MSVAFRALGLALLLVASPAAAQDAADDDARAEFIRGTRALEEGRIADGLACFERSYAESGNPAALFNVVRTLASVGRHLETIDAADRLLREHPALAADLRQGAETLRAEARARLARLVLLGAPADAITLDGRAVSPMGAPPTIVLDPGPHELGAERAAHRGYVWRGELAEGEVRPLSLAFAPLDEGDDEALLVGLGVGIGGAVLVAVAIVAAVLAHDAAQLTPTHDRVLRP